MGGDTDFADALEKGLIVRFPTCPVRLPDPSDLEWLRATLPSCLRAKNLSFHPESGRLRGLSQRDPYRDRAALILRAHGERVQAFLCEIMPELTRGWTVGTMSYRPVQERGRDLKPHASNELIHFDAGAYGATNGDRILRFFVNINPHEDRVWSTKGTFWELLPRLATEAGVANIGDLKPTVSDRLRSKVLRIVSHLIPEAVLANSSPYDRAMRRLHNHMKDSATFQATDSALDSDDGSTDGSTGGTCYREFRFPPFSAWMVLTDAVSHASISGQHALVNTFVVRLAACRHPQLAPFNILRRTA